jgi:radical SAM superfamily enzyme YgiQ (UPF0313 family)
MKVLLVSTYELGHQPLHLAAPAARLLADGHEVAVLDLAVMPYDPEAVAWAEKVAISVPMHTAMRLGVGLARRIGSEHPRIPIAFYGLYAAVGADRTAGRLAERVMAGEYIDELADWVNGTGGPAVTFDVGRHSNPVPVRDLLPALDSYAHLQTGGEHRLVGYVEASHGCRHRCRHCPLPTVYDGRFRIVEPDVLLADVAQLVGLGARHITFGDPDFLNGPAHAGRVIDIVHDAHPDLTFDITAKVEHLLAHPHWVAETARKGLLFITSAFEIASDRILGLLDKGHTCADMEKVVSLTRDEGVTLRPSWLPFTPWSTMADIQDIFRFIDRNDLWSATDPVQLSIRLLLPDRSLLLSVPEILPFLGSYDEAALTYRWSAADSATVDLQSELSRLAEEGVADEPQAVLARMWEASMGSEAPSSLGRAGTGTSPRLTEPWFC